MPLEGDDDDASLITSIPINRTAYGTLRRNAVEIRRGGMVHKAAVAGFPQSHSLRATFVMYFMP